MSLTMFISPVHDCVGEVSNTQPQNPHAYSLYDPLSKSYFGIKIKWKSLELSLLKKKKANIHYCIRDAFARINAIIKYLKGGSPI